MRNIFCQVLFFNAPIPPQPKGRGRALTQPATTPALSSKKGGCLPDDQVLTIYQTAELYGVTKRQVWAWLKKSRTPFERTSEGYIRIRFKDLPDEIEGSRREEDATEPSLYRRAV